MSKFAMVSKRSSGFLAAFLGTAAMLWPATAAQNTKIPNFMDDATVGWLAAGFMFIGYLTHLTLDEIYSVDVLGAHIKKSFGTALKFVDMRYKIATTAMLAAGAALLLIVPPMKTFVDGVSSRPMWTTLHDRLLPHHQWFALIRERGRLAAAPDEPPTAGGAPDPPRREPSPGAGRPWLNNSPVEAN